MEKILNQLVIMNSDSKQIKIPASVQANTNPVISVNDFRQNLKKLEEKN